jgi:hypothetical protein
MLTSDAGQALAIDTSIPPPSVKRATARDTKGDEKENPDCDSFNTHCLISLPLE